MAKAKKCPKCPREFRKKKAWLAHMRRDHGKIDTWKE